MGRVICTGFRPNPKRRLRRSPRSNSSPFTPYVLGMAWSGNLRCLHCDGKLPLYRKLTSGQFCSKAHSEAYWQEQQRLAVERLHQTHDSLRAYKAPADTLEAILGKPAASEPVSSAHYYQADDSTVEAMEPELEVSDMARSAANTGNVTFAGFVVEDKPGLRAWDAIRAAWNGEFLLWPMSRPSLPQSAIEEQDYTLGVSFCSTDAALLSLRICVRTAREYRKLRCRRVCQQTGHPNSLGICPGARGTERTPSRGSSRGGGKPSAVCRKPNGAATVRGAGSASGAGGSLRSNR